MQLITLECDKCNLLHWSVISCRGLSVISTPYLLHWSGITRFTPLLLVELSLTIRTRLLVLGKEGGKFREG